MAKSAPWPPLHRDNCIAKVDSLVPVLRRPTQTHFIAGPLGVIHPPYLVLKLEHWNGLIYEQGDSYAIAIE